MRQRKPETLLPVGDITSAIRSVRGVRVILASELAALYGVPVKRLNEQVRRNADRFPADFMFQLSAEESAALRSQNATLETGRGRHAKYRPLVFSEHGAIMAANVLKSPRAVQMGIYVVRAFVQLRQVLASNRELAQRFGELEARVHNKLKDHDEAIDAILDAIRDMMKDDGQRRGIGFTADLSRKD